VEAFPCQLGQFPFKLPNSSWQLMIDSVANRLPPWKGHLLNHSSRLELIRSTLTAMSVYIAMCIGLLPWVIRALEKILKAFLWTDTEVVVTP
jgi:hypothetical protein